jgi:hypothetical protein
MSKYQVAERPEQFTLCCVCGYDYDDEPPYYPYAEDGRCPTYDFCVSCGVEFGYQDFLIESIRKYRADWLEQGAVWKKPQYKPMEWDVTQQLRKIPPEFW